MCCKSMNIQAWSLAWFFQPSRTFQVMCVTLCDWKAPIKKEQGAGLLENYCWRWRAQSSTHGQCTGFLQWESSSQGSSRRCFLSHTHLVCGRHSTRRSIIQITHKSSQVHFIYINHNYRLVFLLHNLYNIHHALSLDLIALYRWKLSDYWSTYGGNKSPVSWPPLCRTLHQTQQE